MIISQEMLLEISRYQEESCKGDDYKLGFADGFSGFGLILNQMHNPIYLRGYHAGLKIWIEKIESENKIVAIDSECGF